MNTWCLCLDKRKELISQLEEQVNRLLGLTLNKFWCGDGKDSDIHYDKIDIEIDPSQYMNAPGRNHYNAFLSHKKLFREASKNGETILFLEDDAYIIESRISLFEEIEKFIREMDFDALYLGWWQEKYPGDSSDCDEYEEGWLKGDFGVKRAINQYVNICGLHGVVLSSKFAAKLSKAPYGPIDSFINSNLENFKIYYLYPKLIHTKNVYSFCEQMEITHRSIL